ncbi:MAG TPA: lysylphosphatidylglycerol synthase domain-containing protein, partial [Solirubrobacteraceae bacterium]
MSTPSAGHQDVLQKSSSRESTHLAVRAAQRLGALAARRRTALTVVGTLLAVGVLVLVLAGRWGQFASAAASAPWWMLTAAVALQTGSLLARSESWNVCVHAAGGTVGRRRLYRAAGVGYLGN